MLAFSLVLFDDLGVVRSPQRRRDERLCLAAGEQSRPVRAGKQTDLH